MKAAHPVVVYDPTVSVEQEVNNPVDHPGAHILLPAARIRGQETK
jgi:hypothetical protein